MSMEQVPVGGLKKLTLVALPEFATENSLAIGRKLKEVVADIVGQERMPLELENIKVDTTNPLTPYKLRELLRIGEFTHEQRERIWSLFFHEPAGSIAEQIRRRIITLGLIAESYAAKIQSSKETILKIMKDGKVSGAVFLKFIADIEGHLNGTELSSLRLMWLNEYATLIVETQKRSPLASRIEALLQIRPEITQETWMYNSHAIDAIKDMQVIERQSFLSNIRHGKINQWDKINLFLGAINASLEERLWILEIWLKERSPVPQENSSEDSPEYTLAQISETLERILNMYQRTYARKVDDSPDPMNVIRSIIEEKTMSGSINERRRKSKKKARAKQNEAPTERQEDEEPTANDQNAKVTAEKMKDILKPQQEMDKRELEIDARELNIKNKESALETRVLEINKREQDIVKREAATADLQKQQQELLAKERALEESQRRHAEEMQELRELQTSLKVEKLKLEYASAKCTTAESAVEQMLEEKNELQRQVEDLQQREITILAEEQKVETAWREINESTNDLTQQMTILKEREAQLNRDRNNLEEEFKKIQVENTERDNYISESKERERRFIEREVSLITQGNELEKHRRNLELRERLLITDRKKVDEYGKRIESENKELRRKIQEWEEKKRAQSAQIEEAWQKIRDAQDAHKRQVEPEKLAPGTPTSEGEFDQSIFNTLAELKKREQNLKERECALQTSVQKLKLQGEKNELARTQLKEQLSKQKANAVSLENAWKEIGKESEYIDAKMRALDEREALLTARENAMSVKEQEWAEWESAGEWKEEDEKEWIEEEEDESANIEDDELTDEDEDPEEDDELDLPEKLSVWALGEYLQGFIEPEAAGEEPGSDAYALIATRIQQTIEKEPLTINACAQVLKVLLYTYAQCEPSGAKAVSIITALQKKLATSEQRLLKAGAQGHNKADYIAVSDLLQLLLQEPRFYQAFQKAQNTSREFLYSLCPVLPDEPTGNTQGEEKDTDYEVILFPEGLVENRGSKKDKARSTQNTGPEKEHTEDMETDLAFDQEFSEPIGDESEFHTRIDGSTHYDSTAED